jgi:LysM repeat protein
MRRRSPARWLAPVALVTCAVAIYAVVDHELGSDSKSDATSSTRSKTGTGTGATTSTGKSRSTKKAKTSYTVKSGDSLSAIAAKTGVDVGALQEANPDVDASALHPGQKLKLPR